VGREVAGGDGRSSEVGREVAGGDGRSSEVGREIARRSGRAEAAWGRREHGGDMGREVEDKDVVAQRDAGQRSA
jgi:hypothetical protein